VASQEFTFSSVIYKKSVYEEGVGGICGVGLICK